MEIKIAVFGTAHACKEENQGIKYYRNNSCARKMVTKVYIVVLVITHTIHNYGKIVTLEYCEVSISSAGIQVMVDAVIH